MTLNYFFQKNFFEISLVVENNFFINYTMLFDKYKLIIPFGNSYKSYTSTWIIKKFKNFNIYILKTYTTNWSRVCFRGKGFRLRKFNKTNKLTFNFGHSHWSKVKFDTSFFFFKKIRRQNYLCIMKNFFQFKQFKLIFRFSNKINYYTKRGLRLRKQFVKRRFGKLSQIVSLLH